MRSLLVVSALTLAAAGGLGAQGIVDVEPPLRPGPTQPGPVIRLSSNVHTTIEGRVATVEVEERFRNDGGRVAEGSYLYPLPEDAVFTDFSLWIGEEEIRGEMMQAGEAQKIYEDIVRRLKDPALLTFAGHGLIRARVFPIQPGETRKIVLRYTQVLPRAGDALRLKYSIGPRPGRDHGWGDRGRGFSDTFSYDVLIADAGNLGTPYSPTHTIETRRRGRGLEVRLGPDASGDVEVFIPLRRGLVGTSVLAHAPAGEDGFFMLLLAPPAAGDGHTVARDLSLVVDVSGSMSGEKLRQAQAAMEQALGTLGPNDRFQLIAFSSTVRRFREGWSPATPEPLDAARTFVRNLRANGGTNIEGSLQALRHGDVGDDRLPIVVFLTDGLPSVGERRPEQLAQLAAIGRGDARIFTIGIGHDVNTYLLDRVAREGRGASDYVAPGGDVEIAVGGLLQKIQFPALVNLRIVDAPVRLEATYPATLPDLFYGEELVVFGRYDGHGAGTVVVEGERNGRRERFTAQAAFPASEADNDFIPRLWASRRIGELSRTIRLEGPSERLIEEIRDLGLRYGILTEYTSYLVLEPGMTTPAAPMPVEDLMRRNERAGNFAPSAEQTGARAFADAKSSADMAATKTVQEAEVQARRRLDSISARRQGGGATQTVGGRLFIERDGIWTDATHRSTLDVVRVAPFSDAYFALVRALPELRPFLSAGDQVLVTGAAVSVSIEEGGEDALSPRRITEITRQFRGR